MATPRSELIGGAGWVAFGAAVLIASLRMDRLENQDINPYTIPGLLPGLLGVAIMLAGALLVLRAWRRNGWTKRAPASAPRAGGGRQTALAIALCLIFGGGLVGHGLHFWAAASLFVAISILALQAASRRAAGLRLDARSLVTAIGVGVAAGVGITFVFQDIFLVHLP